MRPLLALLVLVITATAAPYDVANPPIKPDHKLTPGAVLNVTPEQLAVRGYAGPVRNVPEKLKRAVFIEYFGCVPAHPGDFEIDHLVSLEIGGSNDIKNLWPQSYLTKPLNSHIKDKVENRSAARVRQTLTTSGHAAAVAKLKELQHKIATDWPSLYIELFGPLPK